MQNTHNTAALLLIKKEIFTFISGNATWDWYLRLGRDRYRGNKSTNKDCYDAATTHGLLLYG